MAGTPQVIIGGGHDGVGGSGATTYGQLFGGNFSSFADREVICVVPTPGTIRNFKVYETVPPGAGETHTWTVERDSGGGWGATTITLTISNLEVSGEDVANSVALSAGDLIRLKMVASGGAATTFPRWELEFEPDTANYYWVGGALQGHTTLTRFACPYAAHGGQTTETYVSPPSPVAGTVRSLYVQLSADPGTAPDAYKIDIRVNAGDSGVTVSIVADNTTGNDTSNTAAISAGDRIAMSCAPVSTPSVTPWVWYGFVIEVSTSGYSPVFAATADQPASGSDEFYPAAGNAIAIGAEANKNAQAPDGYTLSDLYVALRIAPGAGKSLQFTVRINGADSTVLKLIENTDLTGSDLVNTEDLSAGDYLTMEFHPTGTPAADDPQWGFVLSPTPSGPATIAEVNEVPTANIAELNGVVWAGIAEVNGVP